MKGTTIKNIGLKNRRVEYGTMMHRGMKNRIISSNTSAPFTNPLPFIVPLSTTHFPLLHDSLLQTSISLFFYLLLQKIPFFYPRSSIFHLFMVDSYTPQFFAPQVFMLQSLVLCSSTIEISIHHCSTINFSRLNLSIPLLLIFQFPTPSLFILPY